MRRLLRLSGPLHEIDQGIVNRGRHKRQFPAAGQIVRRSRSMLLESAEPKVKETASRLPVFGQRNGAQQ